MDAFSMRVKKNGEGKAGDIGKKAVLMELPISQLNVDHSYQRSLLAEHHITRISNNFNWKLFGTLSVMKRGGKYYVTDGQHRLEAVKLRGDILTVPCNVCESEGMEDEAFAFIGVNAGRNVVRALDKYRAMLVAGDPEICEINKALTKEGFMVSDSDSCNHINFPAALITTWRTDKQIAIDCLLMQREIMLSNNEDKSQMVNTMHKGLFIIAQRLDVPLMSLVQKFARFPHVAYVKSMKKASVEYGDRTNTAYVIGIMDQVNYKLRGRKIVLRKQQEA